MDLWEDAVLMLVQLPMEKASVVMIGLRSRASADIVMSAIIIAALGLPLPLRAINMLLLFVCF